MMGAWWAWPGALLLYAGFRLWYDNWRGPLTEQEIAHFLALAQSAPGAEHTDWTSLRHFLENDDGREFVMCNMLRLHADPVVPATGGQVQRPRALLRRYARVFVPELLRRGGHPVVGVRKIGAYIDAWHTPRDPGWTLASMMRYRSRRDLMQLATSPRFLPAHAFKVAALAETYSFPGQMVVSGALQPRLTVGLSLALLAALVHLGSLLLP